jgi:carbamoyl-phosphate synthase large subunit
MWKGLRSLETGKAFGSEKLDKNLIPQKLITPTPDRFSYIRFAFESGYTAEEIHEMTAIDPWFLRQIEDVIRLQTELEGESLDAVSKETLARAKRCGISDAQLAKTWGAAELAVREKRKAMGVRAVFNRVDTCAAEFESFTPYLYSSYESACEADPSDRRKVMILGSGPNRIGQGIEFDYCCCHASFALQELGWESIMVNCNPETVSTDYDTSDRLYFEPLTLEHVLNIFDVERPDGVIVQFGGQTPLTLALPLKRQDRPGGYRSSRGSQIVWQAAGRPGHSGAGERFGYQRGRSLRHRAAHRLSGAGAAQLCAGRARHGDRLRRGNGA